jgi:hypothetical protein
MMMILWEVSMPFQLNQLIGPYSQLYRAPRPIVEYRSVSSRV